MNALAVVADVQVRERRNSAIAVCNFPPVLELGPSAEYVLDAIKHRLREAIAPCEDGSSQTLRVHFVIDTRSEIGYEELR